MKHLFTIISVITIASTAFIASCKEDPAPTIAEIRVVDEDDNPVPYADVILACTSSLNLPCEIEIVAEADQFGVYRREFELPSVLQVISEGVLYDTTIIGIPPNETIVIDSVEVCGETFISIKPEQTTVQTVILYPC